MVFDTTTVVSALLFSKGRLVWLRGHWREHGCMPLISRDTAGELSRVLCYPKFELSPADARELLADYLLFCEVIEPQERRPSVCRDKNDQPFLNLAQSGKADVLVSGDLDLLALAGQTVFLIETPEAYRRRISPAF
ncbi:MAG: putative toxin-antitoxin system toxin component, PIN family [Candidatus Sulfotelmatobacter sp.]